jgi:ubiquitin C-terminal hydrolase
MENRLPIPLANYGAICWRNAAAQLLFLCDDFVRSISDTDGDAMNYILDAFGTPGPMDESIYFMTTAIANMSLRSRQFFEVSREYKYICQCGKETIKQADPEYFVPWPVVGFWDIKYSCDDCRTRGVTDGAAKHYVSVKSLPKYLIINDMTDLRDTIVFKNVSEGSSLRDVRYHLLGYIVYTGSHYYTIGRLGGHVYIMNDASITALPQMPASHPNTTAYLYMTN